MIILAYNKPWTDFDDQLRKLKDRGLIITDEVKALEYLQRIGYYRLSGYLYAVRKQGGLVSKLDKNLKPIRKNKRFLESNHLYDEYCQGVTFANIIDLYVFDKKLRQLCLDALERIEIALRVDVVHALAKEGPLAYTNPINFNSDFGIKCSQSNGLTKHHTWISSVAKNCTRSKQKFIEHIKNEYGYPLPLWAAAETWDFGCLAIAYNGLPYKDANAIAEKFGIKKEKNNASGQIFSSYINGLRYLRNVCAHHSRLWNLNITEQPSNAGKHYSWLEFARKSPHFQARPFFLLCIVNELLKVINPNSKWGARLKEHISTFPNIQSANISVYGMGVEDKWLEWDIWK